MAHHAGRWYAGASALLRTTPGAFVGGILGPLVLTVPVDRWLLGEPYRPSALYIAVVVALAAVGGPLCGAIAGLTAFLSLWYFAYEPRESFELVTGEEAVSLVLVGVCLVAVVAVVWRVDRARERAARARAETERGRRREAVLLDLARALNLAENREAVRELLTSKIRPAVGAAGSAVLEPIAGDLAYDLASGYGNRVRPGWEEVTRQGSPARYAIDTGEPVFLRDRRELAGRWPLLASLIEGVGDEAHAILPFSVADGARAALVLSFEAAQEFGPEERRFLETLAQLVGGTLRRIHAVTQFEEDRLGAAFDAMLHGVALHRAIRDPGGQVIDFEVRYVNHRFSRWAERFGAPDADVGSVGASIVKTFPAARSSGLFDEMVRVVETGQPFVRDPWTFPVPGGEPITMLVQVTRVGPDEVLLVIRDVGERERDRRARERALVRAARDRAVIQRLEQALLPEELPAVPRHRLDAVYLPAQREITVGGDWYDVVSLPNGELALAVGDVAGHGIDATATMVFARSVLRALLTEGSSPEDALARLDSILVSQGAFVTCWLARYDPERGVATVASAGHLPAILVSPGAARAIEVPLRPPLGIGSMLPPVSEMIVVPTPGMLFAYTDGLVERRSATLDQGIDLLVRELKRSLGRPLVNGWLTDLVQRVQGEEPTTDDLCALAIVREG